jgi:ligand-binding sensor domain-containing protein/two-component sensor histidine kinase
MKPNHNKYSLLPKRIISFSFFVSVFYLVCISTKLFGQTIDNLHIEKVQEDGLSNVYISCIQQDRNGFLWFGTVEGLFRYDGYNYKPFRNLPGDTTTIVNNAITSLFPEKKKLWVGSLGGLSCIDINTQIVKNYTTKDFLQVYTILPKNDSVFWVGTSTGLFQFNKKKSQWERVPSIGKNVFINSICDDKKNHLYLTTQNGFYCYTISTGASKYYRPDLPRYPNAGTTTPLTFLSATSDHEGNIWMGTWDAGLVRFNPKTEETKSWSHQTDDVHLLPYKIVTGLLQDNIGNIWIANKEGGLTIFNPSKNKFTNYPVEWGSENKISGSVKALFRDRSGTVWIGTENGIYKYDPCRFFLSRTDMLLKTDSGLQQTHISPITMLKDKDGLWWMGMYEGLFIFDQKTGVLQDCNKKFGLPANLPVFNIIQDLNGTIWLTTKNALVKISKKTDHKGTSFQEEIFKSPEIQSAMYSLYIDKENRIWIGTNSEGIFKFDQASKKFISCNYQEKNFRHRIKQIRTFCELSKDSLLIGGEHTGLILLHTNSGRYEKINMGNATVTGAGLSLNVIYKKGENIWMGTDYGGLLQTNTHFKKPFIETTNEGLPSMTISAIEGDKHDNIWLLTGAGVVEFHIPDRKITVFDKKDGIKNLDELYSIIGGDKDDISIGGRGTIYNFNPANIIKNTQPPDVMITDLRIFDKEYTINKGETIKLNYNQNYFTFEYVALNYTQSKLNRYAYKMDGLDKKWNYAGPRRYVSYANLDEGTYTFNVKASNNEGVWNNVPVKLILIITPPFWHRWWFYLIFSIVVLSLMYVIYVYNMNQLKIRLQLRDKIARDLHDDIGSTLSGINIFSKIALQKIDTDRRSSRELLEKISSRSEKTLDALSDIVWSINTRNDGMDNFLRKSREYLAEVLEVQAIPYDFNVDHDMENLKIGMATRKELYLIFKEAICNASKYARCSFIQIGLTKYKDVCTLTIHDNGSGFNINTVSSGNGIYNMKHRAEKMDAVFHIESEENKGTLITLSFRIPRFR